MRLVKFSLISIILILSGCQKNDDVLCEKLKEEFSIVVFLDEEANKDEVQQEIESIENVSVISFKSSEDWKLEMMESSEILEATLQDIDNPLLDTFIIKIDDFEELDNTVNKLKDINNVKMVKYDEQIKNCRRGR